MHLDVCKTQFILLVLSSALGGIRALLRKSESEKERERLCMTVYDLLGHGTWSVPPSHNRIVNVACGSGVAFLGFWTVKTVLNPISGQVFDEEHDESGVLRSAEWHDDDWLDDGIREAWLLCFVRMVVERERKHGVAFVENLTHAQIASKVLARLFECYKEGAKLCILFHM
ncbi:uncharacterized protein TNCV_174672 [Trichonephila clavipes]|nr:uncharacterized protein TNCV_174672 [Trichonephila clavipes]